MKLIEQYQAKTIDDIYRVIEKYGVTPIIELKVSELEKRIQCWGYDQIKD